MKNQEMNTIELDVMLLLKTLWRKKFKIVLVALVTTVLAFIYSLFLVTPMYDSTTRIYVVNQRMESGTALTNQDLQAGSYLVKDYKEIILSQDVLLKVQEELGLTEDLREKISVSIPLDTRIVSITVRDKDPHEAARIANSLRGEAAKKIVDVTKVNDVTTLEEATAATVPSTPRTKRNVLIGFVLGAFLSTALVLIVEILDDRVKRPQDIEEVLGFPLLGVVPNVDKLK